MTTVSAGGARVIQLLVSLVTLPLTFKYLGPELYGLWMVLLSIISAMGFADLAADLRTAGARVLTAGVDRASDGLPALAPDQADADAICLIQSFYAFLLRLAQARGANVDRPPHLQKVTRTR